MTPQQAALRIAVALGQASPTTVLLPEAGADWLIEWSEQRESNLADDSVAVPQLQKLMERILAEGPELIFQALAEAEETALTPGVLAEVARALHTGTYLCDPIA